MKRKLLLIITLFISFIQPIYASESDHYTVTNEFKLLEGMTLPEVTFEYDVTAVQENSPTLAIDSVTFSSNDEKGKAQNGVYTITKTSDITLSNLTRAGIFEYTVKQKDLNQVGLIQDTSIYTLKVYIVNTAEGGLALQQINVYKEGEDSKQNTISFSNTCDQDTSLTIEKNTVGDLADKTKDFTFTIKFIPPFNHTNDQSYTGKIGSQDVVCKVNENATFTLHDSQQLIFDSIPVGTKYEVVEVGANDGYIPSLAVVENGIKFDTVNAKDEDDLSTDLSESSHYLGENENKVTYTNTYNSSPVTGISNQDLPYIILIGASSVALIIMLIIKKIKC